jgi:hypothetical protein
MNKQKPNPTFNLDSAKARSPSLLR